MTENVNLLTTGGDRKRLVVDLLTANLGRMLREENAAYLGVDGTVPRLLLLDDTLVASENASVDQLARAEGTAFRAMLEPLGRWLTVHRLMQMRMAADGTTAQVRT